MSDDPAPPIRHPHHAPPTRPVLFAPEGSPPPTSGGDGNDRNWIPWVAALIVILVIVAIILFISIGGRSGSQSSAGSAPYAPHLVISNVHISRASNFAGDELTYVDGTIGNRGNLTVTGITVQVLFASLDQGEAPQAEQVPLQLIRTRQPYIDTQPVNAAPLTPGDSHDFRLIFDDISPMWNQQIPAIQIQNVTTRH